MVLENKSKVHNFKNINKKSLNFKNPSTFLYIKNWKQFVCTSKKPPTQFGKY